MIRANIYSLDRLPINYREQVYDGLEMVAGYMGETIASKELLIRLPTDTEGKVNPFRVGLGNLDIGVELHLMAIPFDKNNQQKLGVSGSGTGWAFVDSSPRSSQHLKTTTAHEVAHAFDFVSPDSVNANINN